MSLSHTKLTQERKKPHLIMGIKTLFIHAHSQYYEPFSRVCGHHFGDFISNLLYSLLALFDCFRA